MKKMLALVAILAVTGLVQADPFGTLASQLPPPYVTFTQTNSAIDTHLTMNANAALPYAAVVTNSQFGDDYQMTATLVFDQTAKTALGLIARGDAVNLNVYEAAMNPNDGYLSLVKVIAGGQFVNLQLDQIEGFDITKNYKLVFSAIGSSLDAKLYDGSSLVGEVSATDGSYTTGQVGFFELKTGGACNGEYLNASIVPEPATMSLLVLGVAGLLRRKS